jgi:hypothetical protein
MRRAVWDIDRRLLSMLAMIDGGRVPDTIEELATLDGGGRNPPT